jgi:hypothetical protein
MNMGSGKTIYAVFQFFHFNSHVLDKINECIYIPDVWDISDITGSSVNNTAQITCSASFFAPCGINSPLRRLPPTILKEAI